MGEHERSLVGNYDAVVLYSADEDPAFSANAEQRDIDVLIVDDEHAIVEEISDYLSVKGFVCESALSSFQALKIFSENSRVGVVFTDIRMSGVDGLELLRNLKEQLPPDREVEVIILTGHAGRDEAIEALHSGAMDFLTKPVSLKHLEHVASRAIDAVRSRYAEKHYKETLEKALDKERQLNQMQREFVSMVSHEFRTPLAIIDGTAQRLSRRKEICTPNELEERSQRVRNAVLRMTNLIERTLCASRLDAGKIEFSPRKCDLAELISQAARQHADFSNNHKISVDVSELPPNIFVDSKLLTQVFDNLLSNATKYSPNEPLIEVKGWSDGKNALVSVRDHGVGIPRSQLPHLFERYFRASTSKGIPGTGIGLNLVKQLVEMHHGTIGGESIEGEGSTFTVSLPVDFRQHSQGGETATEKETAITS